MLLKNDQTDRDTGGVIDIFVFVKIKAVTGS
jgi:hypothetical protein